MSSLSHMFATIGWRVAMTAALAAWIIGHWHSPYGYATFAGSAYRATVEPKCWILNWHQIADPCSPFFDSEPTMEPTYLDRMADLPGFIGVPGYSYHSFPGVVYFSTPPGRQVVQIAVSHWLVALVVAIAYIPLRLLRPFGETQDRSPRKTSADVHVAAIADA